MIKQGALAALLALSLAACSDPGQAPAGAGAKPASTAAAAQSPTTAMPGALAGEAVPLRLSGIGTEPFWNLELDGTQINWRSVADVTPSQGTVVRASITDGAELSGKLGEEPFFAQILKGKCSDGMSDNSFPYTLLVRKGGQELKGCAGPPNAEARN